jgi:hypothetical protein
LDVERQRRETRVVEKGATMNQWEYLSTAIPDISDQRCDEELAMLGERGWELVSVIEVRGAHFFFFKRPMTEGNPG